MKLLKITSGLAVLALALAVSGCPVSPDKTEFKGGNFHPEWSVPPSIARQWTMDHDSDTYIMSLSRASGFTEEDSQGSFNIGRVLANGSTTSVANGVWEVDHSGADNVITFRFGSATTVNGTTTYEYYLTGVYNIDINNAWFQITITTSPLPSVYPLPAGQLWERPENN